MLQLSKALINVPVMSLRVGGQVATAIEPIINPTNLKIEGWFCADTRSKKELVLLSQDVRELLPQGLVIDDFDVLADPDDLVRLKDLLQLNFPLIGHNVVSESKSKLGKVSDFATETTTFYIQKLYTSQPLLKSLKGGSTSVDRNQIIEINQKQIVVKDPLQLTRVRRDEEETDQSTAIQPAPVAPIQ